MSIVCISSNWAQVFLRGDYPRRLQSRAQDGRNQSLTYQACLPPFRSQSRYRPLNAQISIVRSAPEQDIHCITIEPDTRLGVEASVVWIVRQSSAPGSRWSVRSICSQAIESRLADQPEPIRRPSITAKSNRLAGFLATFIATCEIETDTTRTDSTTNHVG